MECPHLNENVNISTPCSSVDGPILPWTCSGCLSEQSPWLCLQCGLVSCGRYVKGHAKLHHEQNTPHHSVCLDCDSWAVFCYQCDDFVVNDTETGQIDKVRQHLQTVVNNAIESTDGTGNDDEYMHETGYAGTPPPVNPPSSDVVRAPLSMPLSPAPSPCTINQEEELTTTNTTVNATSSMTNTTLPVATATYTPSTSSSSPSSSLSLNIASSCSGAGDTKENQRVSTRRKGTTEGQENNKKRIKIEETPSNSKPKIKAKTPGLRNLGNTCFMNAVLQSLSNIQSFCGYIKQLPSLESKVGKKKIQTRSCKDGDVFVVEELRKTLVALWGGSKSAISPECLFSVIWKVVPRFRGYQQQDAHEFMRYLLDRLHTELLTLLPYPNSSSPYISPKGKSTIVTTIFGGILQNEVKCLMCGMESKKHDPFLDLSLDIPPKFTAKCPSPKNGEPVCHLHDCLSSFTEIEELEETELYMCNNCKKRQKSTKKFWIRKLPNVLCLHLKRFRWNTNFRIKVDTHIDFPLQGLNMHKYLLNNLHETRNSYGGSNEYDLAAVIVHHGSGAGSGHYTSYAIFEGRWYHFNDSTVTCVDEEVVKRCKAYIMFYVKRDIKVPHYFSPDKDGEDDAEAAAETTVQH